MIGGKNTAQRLNERVLMVIPFSPSHEIDRDTGEIDGHSREIDDNKGEGEEAGFDDASCGHRTNPHVGTCYSSDHSQNARELLYSCPQSSGPPILLARARIDSANQKLDLSSSTNQLRRDDCGEKKNIKERLTAECSISSGISRGIPFMDLSHYGSIQSIEQVGRADTVLLAI